MRFLRATGSSACNMPASDVTAEAARPAFKADRRLISWGLIMAPGWIRTEFLFLSNLPSQGGCVLRRQSPRPAVAAESPRPQRCVGKKLENLGKGNCRNEGKNRL